MPKWDGWQQPETYQVRTIEACTCGATLPHRRVSDGRYRRPTEIAAWWEQHTGDGHGDCTAEQAGQARRRARRAARQGEAA